jgi:hypothetical protein
VRHGENEVRLQALHNRINLKGILKTLFSNENRDEFQKGKNQNLYMVALKRFCQETLNTWCVKSADFF